MTGVILADTGPLISFLIQDAEHHDWACEQMAVFQPPLLMCEPVLTEAEYLLRRQKLEVRPLLDLLERGVLQVAFNVEEEVGALKLLLQRYADRPMSLADACLVRMSETRDKITIWTLDTDFRVYRRRGRLVIPTLFPPGV